MKWEWKGKLLAPLNTIIRRMLALPVLRVAQCVVFAATLAGWGWDDAVRTWRNME
jgi:hypothetical protein